MHQMLFQSLQVAVVTATASSEEGWQPGGTWHWFSSVALPVVVARCLLSLYSCFPSFPDNSIQYAPSKLSVCLNQPVLMDRPLVSDS